RERGAARILFAALADRRRPEHRDQPVLLSAGGEDHDDRRGAAGPAAAGVFGRVAGRGIFVGDYAADGAIDFQLGLAQRSLAGRGPTSAVLTFASDRFIRLMLMSPPSTTEILNRLLVL